MPVAAIFGIIQGIMAIAPQVPGLVEQAKGLVNFFTSKNAISVADQAALHDWIAAEELSAGSGEIRPHWNIEADPV